MGVWRLRGRRGNLTGWEAENRVYLLGHKDALALQMVITALTFAVARYLAGGKS